MANKKVFTVPYRRKQKGKTNYKTRMILLKSKLPRLVVRKSNKHMMAQLVGYDEKGDKVLKVAHTKELEKYGWEINTRNIPAAYLVGLLIGVKSKGQEAILDIGLQTPIKGSRIFAVLKGAADGGMKIKVSKEEVPKDERISGKHISGFANHLKDDKHSFEKRFSGYLKHKKDPLKIEEYFEKAKEKILSHK